MWEACCTNTEYQLCIEAIYYKEQPFKYKLNSLIISVPIIAENTVHFSFWMHLLEKSYSNNYKFDLILSERKKIFRLGFHFVSVPKPFDADKPVMTALGFLGRLPGGKFWFNYNKARRSPQSLYQSSVVIPQTKCCNNYDHLHVTYLPECVWLALNCSFLGVIIFDIRV